MFHECYGRSPVIVEITYSHVFTREINYASTRSQYSNHRDSNNDWRGSYEIKMNNLEFSRLLRNLKIVTEI